MKNFQSSCLSGIFFALKLQWIDVCPTSNLEFREISLLGGEIEDESTWIGCW